MKATLVHNPTAGRGDPSPEGLLQEIRMVGFEPSYLSTKEDEYRSALQDPGALVFAAGGDGTIIKVARALRGSSVPLVVVPIGTANNIAASLGIPLDVTQAIETGARGEARLVDLGRATTEWGDHPFVEGIGLGLFPQVMASITEWQRELKNLFETDEEELARDVQHWLDALEAVEERDYEIHLDGRDLSGKYILVEAMNMPTMGPRLRLTDGADPSDGRLDLVLATAADRRRIESLLCSRLEGKAETSSGLAAHRGRELRIAWRDSVPHLDDALWESPERDRGRMVASWLNASVEPGAIAVMVPTSR